MSYEQCWALNFDRSRCQEPAEPDQYFCEEHDTGYGLDPVDIYCLPEAEMPPDLVACIRSCCPTWPFPEPSPPIVTFGLAAPSHSSAPASETGAMAPPARPAPLDSLLSLSEEDADAESLAWLRASLREVIEDVKAGGADPMQKATAVARLGGLFLRTFRTAEVQKENRRLRKSLAAMETRLATLEAAATVPTACCQPTAHSAGAYDTALQDRTGGIEAVPLLPGSAGFQPACRAPGGLAPCAPSAADAEHSAVPTDLAAAGRASP